MPEAAKRLPVASPSVFDSSSVGLRIATAGSRYLGELSDVKFRKTDLLKLMAEREGNGFRGKHAPWPPPKKVLSWCN